MGDELLQDLEALASSLEAEDADAVTALFWIVSDAEYVPDATDVYTPFVYPH